MPFWGIYCTLSKLMETKIIKAGRRKPNAQQIRKAAEIIDSGGFVVFPTETVYGIGCRVKRDSLARLDAIKERSADKYYTLHIGEKSEVGKYVPFLGLRAQKLIKTAWPGPLTIVFELSDEQLDKQRKSVGEEIFENLYKDNSIGIRCPDNAVASMLLKRVNQPVVAPSANKSGQKAAVTAEEALEQLSGEVEMVLDGGPCKYQKNSTVVKIGKDRINVLREGIVPLDDVEAMSKVNFLFVCTGNTCRSPMAAGMFKKKLAEKFDCEVDQLDKKGYKISSVGTMGMVGFGASAESVAVCAAMGVDISSHESRALAGSLITESDYIFVMSQAHQKQVISLDPKASEKCVLLIDGKDVADPIGQSQEVYNVCAKQIEQAVKKRISELLI